MANEFLPTRGGKERRKLDKRQFSMVNYRCEVLIMSKNKKWMRLRHKVLTALLMPPFGLYIRWKYGIKVEKFKNQGKRPYLILMNHQTGFDQFFVAMTFNRPVYYLASEDIFSMGWVSRIIEWIVAPIPIKKQTTDLQAVKNCIRVAKEGGTLCIAPEGQRTFHGKTVHMSAAIGGLAKKLGLPIAIFRIEGGYGVQPRWSDVVRGGGMRSRVSRVIEPEEYKDLTGDQLFAIIEQELRCDEACVTGEYPHKKNAEYLERVVYVCPWCGLSEFESNGDILHCKRCGKQIRHKATKELEGVNCDFPHRFVSDWYLWQNDYINRTDLLALTDAPLYEETVQLSLVHPNSHKDVLQKAATLRLYGDRITLDDREFPFRELDALTILGKNKLNLYHGKDILQIKGSKRFNGLKYLNFYHRYKNQTTGDGTGTYLGL